MCGLHQPVGKGTGSVFIDVGLLKIHNRLGHIFSPEQSLKKSKLKYNFGLFLK